VNTEDRTPGADTGRRKEAVRKATAEDVPRLARVLARAFYEDPVMRWVFPDDSRRLRQLERSSVSVSLKMMCLPHGETYTTEDVAGGALWLPPGKERLGPLDSLRLLPHMAASWGRDLPRALRSLAHVDAKHPRDPHYYLFILGVDPDRQGEGIGTALMRPVLRTCVSRGVPAYLEASGPRNRDLYARNGFEVVEETALPGGGPPVWRMWREPGALRSSP
jgi:GNAT superfamily N-acetyltransferase